jgi:hypothetical protein
MTDIEPHKVEMPTPGIIEFSGTVTPEAVKSFTEMFKEQRPLTTVTMWGLADLPWWKDWYWRIRGALFGDPYPEEVIVSGPVRLDHIETLEPIEGMHHITGRFTKAGVWQIDPPDEEVL